MQYGLYIDQTRCTGCFACVVACKDWHDVPAGPAALLRVKTVEKGNYPDLFVAFLPLMCYHCEHPACVPICPANAITKRPEDGIVIVDSELCLTKDNCGICIEACPYHAPQFGGEADAVMQKCDLCLDRWNEGKKPVCVESCPTQALDAGPMDELGLRYGDVKDAEGFVNTADLNPSIVFKPKCDVKKRPVRSIEVTPGEV